MTRSNEEIIQRIEDRLAEHRKSVIQKINMMMWFVGIIITLFTGTLSYFVLSHFHVKELLVEEIESSREHKEDFGLTLQELNNRFDAFIFEVYAEKYKPKFRSNE